MKTTPKPKKRPTFWLILIIAAALITCIAVITGGQVGQTLPTAAPTQVSEPTQPPVAKEQLPAALPVDSAFVQTVLEAKDFECGSAEKQNSGLYMRTCEYSITQDPVTVTCTVFIWSRAIASVDMIEATVIQTTSPTDDIAQQLLGYISTIPFSEADAVTSRGWVETNISKLPKTGAIETDLKGVHLSLMGPIGARSLEIGQTILP
jgi:hypothetical protein